MANSDKQDVKDVKDDTNSAIENKLRKISVTIAGPLGNTITDALNKLFNREDGINELQYSFITNDALESASQTSTMAMLNQINDKNLGNNEENTEVKDDSKYIIYSTTNDIFSDVRSTVDTINKLIQMVGIPEIKDAANKYLIVDTVNNNITKGQSSTEKFARDIGFEIYHTVDRFLATINNRINTYD